MLKQELDELWALKQKIESQEFQKYLVKPIYDELNKLKGAYECESLRELNTLKGKKQGLMFFIGLLKQVDLDLKNKKYELEQLESQDK